MDTSSNKLERLHVRRLRHGEERKCMFLMAVQNKAMMSNCKMILPNRIRNTGYMETEMKRLIT